MKNILFITMLLGVGYSQDYFQPESKEELQAAVDMWVDDNATALSDYGEINSWDVSLIINMDALFYGKSTFNDDISGWDVSNVIYMFGMFCDASSFNQDISNWDISSVIYMDDMLHGASSFNQDISSWDVSSVIDMSGMFYGASSFNQDISNWDVSSVTYMNYMFEVADALSDVNKCNIHLSFSSNVNWPYNDWLDICFITNCSYEDTDEDGYDDVSYEAGANNADPCYGVVCDDDPEMICICGECTYEDEQGDTGGGEDCSYGDECFETGATSGDLNLDGVDNVLDVVTLVNQILNP